ncbi:MAG: UDP-N-acetylmuramate dehydrogenase [Deltaproteobacteria bacterium]|nr:UDP-N-acetylmuramate dehydrogenase [Deltaproteobacteria bacterium]
MSDSTIRSVYFMGICGTGMGSLAGLVQSQGYEVSGSDEHVYPPMSTRLEDWGIPVLEGYKPEHLSPKPDLVVVGNVIRKVNPEASAMRDSGLEHISMPQAIARFGIGDKHSIVVAGTHGKTTTSSLIAHLLMHAKLDPSYLVGGVLVGYRESFRSGDGDFFAIEGDEYDTAYFDKGPKFRHYKPKTAIISSLEFDHADIFDSVEDVENAFTQLVTIVPEDGHLVAWAGATRAVRLIQESGVTKKVTLFDTKPGEGVRLWMKHCETTPDGLVFEAVRDGESLGEMTVPMWGEFSARNVLAAIAATEAANLSADQLRAGLASFKGVKRRMEVIGESGGVTVVDDFGHHPTAVTLTLAAARKRWPGRRVTAVFEPRSATSRRNVFQNAFIEAFSGADHVVVGTHVRLAEVDESQRFSPEKVASELTSRGLVAAAPGDVDAVLSYLERETRQGDVIIVFSNGDFGGLHGRLVKQIGETA